MSSQMTDSATPVGLYSYEYDADAGEDATTQALGPGAAPVTENPTQPIVITALAPPEIMPNFYQTYRIENTGGVNTTFVAALTYTDVGISTTQTVTHSEIAVIGPTRVVYSVEDPQVTNVWSCDIVGTTGAVCGAILYAQNQTIDTLTATETAIPRTWTAYAEAQTTETPSNTAMPIASQTGTSSSGTMAL